MDEDVDGGVMRPDPEEDDALVEMNLEYDFNTFEDFGDHGHDDYDHAPADQIMLLADQDASQPDDDGFGPERIHDPHSGASGSSGI